MTRPGVLPATAVPATAVPATAGTREELARHRAAMPGRVAAVLTMGALHAGHLALVERARAVADHVVVTVFVNPLQFAAGEDLDRYPRTLEADLALLGDRADLVFAPGAAEVYPAGAPQVRVSAGPLGDVLEGAHRPGHFDGVLTVVTVLLHLLRPDVAVFGEKDAQQLALVRRLVADLAVPTRIEAVPTVRDADGLALSSRNAYLAPGDRRRALAVPAALAAARAAARSGAAAEGVRAAAAAVLADADGVAADYVEVVDPVGFTPPAGPGEALALVAARVGATRLIDNARVELRR
ncbi:MAG: pantoate--beta-alanine ligase [Kineosporiaceae bacterium]